jgi:hypothetical protein
MRTNQEEQNPTATTKEKRNKIQGPTEDTKALARFRVQFNPCWSRHSCYSFPFDPFDPFHTCQCIGIIVRARGRTVNPLDYVPRRDAGAPKMHGGGDCCRALPEMNESPCLGALTIHVSLPQIHSSPVVHRWGSNN